jgi:two-component system OmpR family response regulator/two-component system response regulator QseB
MRFLLVEDDRMIGASLRDALRLEGYAVDWVRDAGAAHATLASERFDLVLLDLGLPPGRRARRRATGSMCCAACARARTRRR